MKITPGEYSNVSQWVDSVFHAPKAPFTTSHSCQCGDKERTDAADRAFIDEAKRDAIRFGLAIYTLEPSNNARRQRVRLNTRDVIQREAERLVREVVNGRHTHIRIAEGLARWALVLADSQMRSPERFAAHCVSEAFKGDGVQAARLIAMLAAAMTPHDFLDWPGIARGAIQAANIHLGNSINSKDETHQNRTANRF